MRAAPLSASRGLHPLKCTGKLVHTPITLARNETRRHIDGAARKRFKLANPGRPADGDGWMMLAGRGPQSKTGKQGLMGPKGDKGEPAATLPRYRAIGALTDATILPPLELRPLFAQYQQETS
jgi:hypothetical protein